MSVLTAPRSQAFSRQMALPFAPIQTLAIKPTRGTGSAGPLREPPRGVAKERSDKPGGP